MKLLDHNLGVITNHELLQVLEERGAGLAKAMGRAQPSERLVHQYITSLPCKPLAPAQLKAFFDALQCYNLSKGELLQLSNLAPRTAVAVHLVVDDCEARLGDEGIQHVISVVEELVFQQAAPGQPPPAAAAGGGQ